MQSGTNWVTLWQELVTLDQQRKTIENKAYDFWKLRAKDFEQGVRERWKTPDSSRDFVCTQVGKNHTLLDIGAGTGAWSILLAKQAKKVTALEPSPAMLAILRNYLAQQNATNIEIIEAAWPENASCVEKHDFSLASHSMYGCKDFCAYINAMQNVTRCACFLVMRLPLRGNLMEQAAQRVLGQPYDSPNSIIAYHILLEMGIYPNILMENSSAWKPWVSATMDDALEMLCKRLGLARPGNHETYLKNLLAQNLRFQDGNYVWPSSVRSALIYWNV